MQSIIVAVDATKPQSWLCLAARTGHMESALHGLQRGGPQNMDLLYPPVDDLDNDVGIVDAEVLELLLSRPN